MILSNLIEFIQLIISIVIIVFPGYLWSFIFSKKIKLLERIVFGFVLSITILILSIYGVELFFQQSITRILVILIYLIYSIPIIIIFIISLKKIKRNLLINYEKIFNIKTLIIILILAFAAIMTFLPHLLNSYYLPFHVDEWIHWTYTRTLMETGSTTFIEPYTGVGIISPLEIGFHIMTAVFSYISQLSLQTLFLFLPTIFVLLTCLAAFNLGDRCKPSYGFESAFLVVFIPTTCRILGPSFFVPVGLGLLFLVFILWLCKLKNMQSIFMFPILIFLLFIIHPPTALAGLMIIIIYSILLLLKKQLLLGGTSLIISIMPIVSLLILTTRWSYDLELVLNAINGFKYEIPLQLPQIWISFEQMGFIIWLFFIIGIYYSISRDVLIEKVMGLSAIMLIIGIGIYDKLGYGIPIFYERSFLYLFLLVLIIAGYGLRSLRILIADIISNKKLNILNINISINYEYLLPIFVILILFFTAVPAQINIPYYQLINEDDYETFEWIHDNINSYRTNLYKYDKGVLDPYKASPFVAITGLNIISSSMHPIYGYELSSEVQQFIKSNCDDTNFLKKYDVSVIYSNNCNKNNLTMIYNNLYLYPDLYEN